MSAFTDESWYRREIVTPELKWLGDELCQRTGRPADAAGDKGNEAHNSGSHRSQEWLKNSRFCDNRTYTVQSGLTADQARHIAGFDFTPGSAAQMVEQCQRLYSALKAGQLEEVREFYGNVDGDEVVDGWNNLENRNASSDSSHLWHWHLSFDRRRMTDQALMERVVAIVMGDAVVTFLAPCKVGDKGPHVSFLQYALWDLHEAKRLPTEAPLWPIKDNVPQIPPTMDQKTGDAMRRLLDGGDGVHFTPLLAKRLVRKLGALDSTPGPQGIQGIPGPQGDPGPAAVLAEGDVLVVQRRTD